MTESWAKKRFRLPAGVVWRLEDFGFLLYDRRTDNLYEGNRSGLKVLRLLEEGLSQSEICRRLSDRRRVDGEVMRRDVGEFVDFLEAEGLVEIQ